LCGGGGADTTDHIVPWSAGGGDEPSNLRAAHRVCNSRRGGLRLSKAMRMPKANADRW
jgi:5-methylcytosine-specific restriction endonuclease McrA